MKLPNVFLIGAPRCGTTSMCRYLAGHPRIFMPALKEPYFFADDFAAIRDVDTMSRYCQLYRPAGDTCEAVIDGSVLYMYSSVAVPRIFDFAPDAKLIVMVRSPVDAVRSYHGRLVATFAETERDFGKAWRRKRPSSANRVPALANYRQIAKFGEQLSHVLEVFPREQVHVVLFDDFVDAPQQSYNDVLDFLHIEPDGRSDFSPAGQAIQTYRLNWLARRLRRLPAPVKRVEQAVKKGLGVERFGIVSMAEQLLGKQSKRRPLPARLQSELIDEYRDDVSLLSAILGRDLRPWLQVRH